MEWIAHQGGPCPEAPDTWLIMRCASGYVSRPHKAGERHLQKLWEWASQPKRDVARIVAYQMADNPPTLKAQSPETAGE